jgi:hypothetical protein
MTSLLLLTCSLAAPPDGAALYKAQCARCHGANGEGAKKYAKPLVGDLSPLQLAKIVRETMPEDNPNSLTEAESVAIAEHMHAGFYSAVARDRARPARIDLARLTVPQYRNAVADVIGGFRQPLQWGPERGLAAEYFAGRNTRRDKRVLERIDPAVDFDFGTDPPLPEKIEAHEFSISWTGSLVPPETGEYEFLVRTEHAARLWVNDLDQNRPLIDAWVKSGRDTEFTGTTFLLAGRPVSVRLDYSKAKQGVDDSKNQKGPPPKVKSSVRLLWKRPHSVPEIIPARALWAKRNPETFAVTAKFPPDDRSLGWERGSAVSKEWDAAATNGALETATYVSKRINELAGTRDDDKDRAKKVKQFCATFAERAFRRPLTSGQLTLLVEKVFETAKDFDLAVKRSVLFTLKSPFFLYREVAGGSDDFDAAARLSFALWDSVPDKALLAAAAKGELKSKDQLTKQAERMLADPRARAKLRGFLLAWVHADQPYDLTRDAKKFPGFDPATVADLRTSLELFLDDVLWGESSDFRKLALSDETYVNARLAKYYGATVPTDAGFVKVKLDGGNRSGVLTHPYLMATFSSPAESSPIHRGVFLARGVLGLALRPPPEAVAPLAPDLHPGLSTRERVILQTKAASCLTCHAVINPLGFTLEQYDAVGRFRAKDAGKPIDVSGEYLTRGGKTVKIDGAKGLANFVATSDEAHEAFVEQLFHHLIQQPVRAYGPRRLDELEASFRSSNFHIRKLAVDIAAGSATVAREKKEKKAD